MSQRAYLLGTALFAVLGAASWSGLLAQGAQTPPAAPPAPGPVAVVDVAKVSREYAQMQAGQRELEAFQVALAREMDAKDAGRFLTDAEKTELATLQKVAQPTQEQQRRITELGNKNTAQAARLRDLQTRSTRTPEEQADLDRLTKLDQAMTDELRKLQEDQMARLDAKGQEISDRVTKALLDAITAVAKEKNLSVVFDKAAVLYGWTDITADVLQKANAAAPAPAAATTPAPAAPAPAATTTPQTPAAPKPGG